VSKAVGLRFKLGPLKKKKGSCCVVAAVWNDLPEGTIMMSELTGKMRFWNALHILTLRSIGATAPLLKMATDANMAVVALQKASAPELSDMLDSAANVVVESAATINSLGKRMQTQLSNDWVIMRKTLMANKPRANKAQAPYKAALHVYNSLSKKLNEANKVYRQKTGALSHLITMDKETADEENCKLSFYPDCSTVARMGCPSGVYTLFPPDADTERKAFCDKGATRMADGCGESWAPLGSWCWRLFPLNGAVGDAHAKSNATDVDKSYLTWEAAKATCQQHGAVFTSNNASDKAAALQLPGWRLAHANKLPNGVRAVWTGKVHGMRRPVLTALGEMKEAPEDFVTAVICRAIPTQVQCHHIHR
jgi:hypothetical protein